MVLVFPLQQSEEAFLFELLEDSGVDELFKRFGLYRRDSLRDFVDCVTHAGPSGFRTRERHPITLKACDLEVNRACASFITE
jgi:hypothetical protein